MGRLHRAAMACLPMTEEDVEALYNLAPVASTSTAKLQRLCESHERLRMELDGSEILNKDAEKELEDAADKLSTCWLTLDLIARESPCKAEREAVSALLRKQQAPGWKTT